MRAYRPEPDSIRPARPILCRPWMARLCAVILAPFSPAFIAYVLYMSIKMQREVTGALLFMAAIASSVAILGSMCTNESAYTARTVLKITWAWLYYPALWIHKLVRWIATGA
jgi:hypothetical protein